MTVGFSIKIEIVFVQKRFGEQRIEIQEKVMINFQEFTRISSL